MGIILKMQCICGYKSDEFFVGHGFSPDSGCDLARCDNCREIVSVRSANTVHCCPKCKQVVQIINIDENETGSSQPYTLECPKCTKLTLMLEQVGMWD